MVQVPLAFISLTFDSNYTEAISKSEHPLVLHALLASIFQRYSGVCNQLSKNNNRHFLFVTVLKAKII